MFSSSLFNSVGSVQLVLVFNLAGKDVSLRWSMMPSFINFVNSGSTEYSSQLSSLKKFFHKGGSMVAFMVAYCIHICSLAL